MRRGFRAVGLLALIGCSGAPGCRREAPAPPAAATPATSATPDLALVEVCPPKTPPAVVELAALEKTLGEVCDRLAEAATAGKAIDALLATGPATLRTAAARTALDETVRHIYVCRAVAGDDDGPCKRIVELEAQKTCLVRRAFFHAARKPADPKWRFPDLMHEACKKEFEAPLCDGYRDAIRAGDPARCPSGQGALPDCAAVAAGDPARCSGPDCVETAGRVRLIAAGGLLRLAAEGSPHDRLLAGAALGRPEACAEAVATFRQACRGAARMATRPAAPAK
ncbi:MAG: hypothetical protein EXR72_05075 [Myxococcales bacterium]|nr:hypothetical protein [Myxococcales bacterium]